MMAFIEANPAAILAASLVILLTGLLIGFRFRRQASEEFASELLATPQFDRAAESKMSAAYRDPRFAQTTAYCIERDTEVQGSILKFLANAHPMYVMIDERIAHKLSWHEKESQKDLDLRFEQFKGEIIGEVNKTLSASSTAIFKRFDDLADRIDRRIDEIAGK